MALQRATRKRAKLKVGLSGQSNGGKTLGALFIAYGALKKIHPDWSESRIWSSIAVIDTENHSSELYSNVDKAGIHIGEFITGPIEPPFTADKYIQNINDCINASIDVPIPGTEDFEDEPTKIEFVVIDSLTHLWDGEGGSKDKQANIAKRTGNGFTSWREPKKEFRSVIDKILQTDLHFIVTMRAKTDYVQEKDSSGKTVVRKIGLNPIIADGTDYEFTLVFDLDSDHIAGVSKDRTGLFDGTYHKISPDTGSKLADWILSSPKAAVKKLAEAITAAESEPNPDVGAPSIEELVEQIRTTFGSKMYDKEKNPDGIDREILYEVVMKYNDGKKNFLKMTDVNKANELLVALQNFGN